MLLCNVRIKKVIKAWVGLVGVFYLIVVGNQQCLVGFGYSHNLIGFRWQRVSFEWFCWVFLCWQGGGR